MAAPLDFRSSDPARAGGRPRAGGPQDGPRQPDDSRRTGGSRRTGDFRRAGEALRAASDASRSGRPHPGPGSPGLSRSGVGAGSAAARRSKRRHALTAWGALLAVTVPTVLAAALDAALTGGVHWIFGLVFVAAAFHAATLVRRRDLLAGVIVPPLAYCAGLLAAVECGVLDAGQGLANHLASLGALLALKPRPLFLGTGLATALIAARWAGTRSGAKR